MKFECTFLYFGKGNDPEKDRARIEGGINMTVIGVSSYEQAEEQAKQMVAKGCTAVELCGGFDNEGVARVQRAVGQQIAVGAVRFPTALRFGPGKFQDAFIYVAGGCDPAAERAVIDGAMTMHVVGLSTYAQAEAAAKELVAKGCTAIELCAGFGNEGIARIQRAVGPDIPVGAVKFGFHPAFGFKTGDEMFGD